jgi:hypothetical protein
LIMQEKTSVSQTEKAAVLCLFKLSNPAWM